MFLGTLSGPFFNHLIGISSTGFNELILTGERVEVWIMSGKIQKDASSSAARKPFSGKKEVSATYSQRSQDKTESHLMVGVVMISKPAPTQQRNNQPRTEILVRQFTWINMMLSQVLPHLFRSNLVTLNEALKNPNTASPYYHPNARCAYHSKSPGHDTNNS